MDSITPGYFIGVNFAYHESSVCVMRGGKIVAALEEERFNRYRHAKPAAIDKGDEFPLVSLEKCLAIAGIGIEEVTAIGCSFEPQARYRQNRHLCSPERSAHGWATEAGEREFMTRVGSIPKFLSGYFSHELAGKWHWLPHHLCHVAGAYAQSGFDEAALLCVDGIAEFDSTLLGVAKGTEIHPLRTIGYPHSLGLLWEKFSEFLGFSEYDATKVMSLAAFGDPVPYRESMNRLLIMTLDRFTVNDSLCQLRSGGFDRLSGYFGMAPVAKR